MWRSTSLVILFATQGCATQAYDTAFAARLQRIVDEQSVLWNTSFSVGLNIRGVSYAAAAGTNNIRTGKRSGSVLALPDRICDQALHLSLIHI